MNNERYIDALKALAEPHRLRLFWLLIHVDQRITVAEAMDVTKDTQYNVSRNLKMLYKTGLLTQEKCGKWVYYTLAPQKLPSWCFIVDSVRGTVEKKSGDTWVDISTPPATSNPRELLRLLSLRLIKPDDELRWIPPTESPQSEEAFSLVGWNGKFASESKSSIRFEAL